MCIHCACAPQHTQCVQLAHCIIDVNLSNWVTVRHNKTDLLCNFNSLDVFTVITFWINWLLHWAMRLLFSFFFSFLQLKHPLCQWFYIVANVIRQFIEKHFMHNIFDNRNFHGTIYLRSCCCFSTPIFLFLLLYFDSSQFVEVDLKKSS